MCYSTCSMNPVENEAVVAEILREADGAVELVEKRSDMPGLRARPGWTSWRVMREDRTNSQSRKQRENQKKKNNAKMQQRRKEWEEKRKQQEEGGGEEGAEGEEGARAEESSKIGEEGNIGGGEDVKMAEAGDMNTEKTSTESNNKESGDRPAPSEFAPPESWDDATLEGLAKSAGLIIHEDFESVPDEWKKRVRSTVFPPTAEEASKMNLERCMRCLPQDMDTGGFFVALFKKVAPMRPRLRKADTADGAEDKPGDHVTTGIESNEPETKKRKVGDEVGVTPAETGHESTNGDNNGTDKKQGKDKGGKQGGRQWDLGNSPFTKPDADKFPPLVEHYGFTDSFPQEQIMVRSNGEAKIMYFMSGAIKKELIDRGLQDKVMPINSGLKAFERNTKRECEVDYRVTQEGIHFIAPHMTKRVVVAEPEDFVRCLGPGGIRLSSFSAEFAEEVRALSIGSFVVALKGYERNVSQKMFIVMWRCRGDAMNCLVAKAEMDGMFSKLRGKGVDVPLTSGDDDNNNNKDKDKDKKDENSESRKN